MRDLFRAVLEDPGEEILLDRAHRALGTRSPDPTRPRDVVCRLHRFMQKETILHRAWDCGDIEAMGSQIKILPDLSGATLKRRALLRPLLDLASKKALPIMGVPVRGDVPQGYERLHSAGFIRPTGDFPIYGGRSDTSARLVATTSSGNGQIRDLHY